MDGLDIVHLHVLEAVVVAGEAQPDAVTRLTALDDDVVTAAMDALYDLGLAWRSAEGLRAVRAVGEAMGAPAGLGPTASTLFSPRPSWLLEDRLAETIEALPTPARTVLDALTWGPPTVAPPRGDGAARDATQTLLDHGLVASLHDGNLALPREVALHLRDGRLHRTSAAVPPALEQEPIGQDAADTAAGGAAGELLALIDDVAQEWTTRPPAVLRGGGLAVRDLRRLATTLEVDEKRAAFVVETAYAAGLVGPEDSVAPAFVPTTAYDSWSALDADARWCALARAWWASPRLASRVGKKDGGASPVNALSEGVHWPGGLRLRRDALTELARADAGTPASADELVARLAWRHPLRRSHRGAPEVEAALAEAGQIGVLGRGALSGAGRALVNSDDDALQEWAARWIPPRVDHVLVQADLTAVAPGRLEGPALHTMRLIADVESRGGATVYRFTPASIRRALDRGWDAARVLDEVGQLSLTPVPQPLEYLVRDEAKRHGSARVGGTRAYIRSDDEALIGSIAGSRELTHLQLERIAPTVLVSPVGPTHLIEALREAGFAPVPERGEAGVAVPSTGPRRAPVRRESPVVTSHVDDELALRTVRTARAAEETRATQPESPDAPQMPQMDPTVSMAFLREAAADRATVWVAYSDAVGGLQRLLVRPTSITGGRVTATVDADGAERTFSIHRIRGVAPA